MFSIYRFFYGITKLFHLLRLLRRPSVEFGLMLIAVGYQFDFTLY